MEKAIQQWRQIWDRGKIGEGKTGTRNKKSTTIISSKPTKKRRQKRTRQINLLNQNMYEADVEHFGDKLQNKHEGLLRLMLQNISNLPAIKTHHKSRQIVDMLPRLAIDVMFLNEIGLNWNKLPPHQQWHDRTLGKINTTTSVFGWNRTDTFNKSYFQPGGTGIIAIDDTAH
jgi:hypothetical protein